MRIKPFLFIFAMLLPAGSLQAAAPYEKPSLLILPLEFTDSNPSPRGWFAEALQGCLGGDVVRQRVTLLESANRQPSATSKDELIAAARKENADFVLAANFQIDNATLMAFGELIDVNSGESVGKIQNIGVMQDFVAFQSRLLYQLRDLLPEYVDPIPTANKPPKVSIMESGMPTRRDPAVVEAERIARERAADPLAIDSSPFIRMAPPSTVYYVVSPDNPNYLYMEGRNFRGFITVNNQRRQELQQSGSIITGPMPRNVLTFPPVGAGAPPINAPGRTPLGAAGQTPINAAGQPGINAQGRFPGADYNANNMAANPASIPNNMAANPTSIPNNMAQPGMNTGRTPNRNFTTETPIQPSPNR